MAEQALDRVQIGSALEQVRREGVAQGVDAAPLVHAGLAFGAAIDALDAGDRDRSVFPLRGEEPRLGPCVAPVRAQLLEQARREQRIAIPTSLALLHANRPAVGVDVRDAQRDQLADAKPRGVGGHQQQPVLALPRLRQDARHFLPAQDLGKQRRRLGARDREADLLATQRRAVEEAQRVDDQAARVPREPALLGQMHEVALDLSLREPIRRPVVELGQTDDGGQVGLARALGQAAHDHVMIHSIAKLAHDALGRAATRAAAKYARVRTPRPWNETRGVSNRDPARISAERPAAPAA